MSDPLTMEDVKERHEDLYDRALQEAPKLRRELTAAARAGRAEGNGSQAFLRDVNELLAHLEALSSQVSSFDEYRWLSHTAVKWQNVFAFLDVPTFVKLNPPSERLLPPVAAAPVADPALTEQELDYWVKTHARFLAYSRIAKTGRLSTLAEMEHDTRMAFVFLASDIIDGKINLVNRIAANSYEHLEWVWMEDLKHLRAYLLWLDRGGAFDQEQKARNYFDVCDHLRHMLTNPGIKAPAAAFDPIRRYLEDRYLFRGKIDVDRREFACWLVGHKAFHLFQVKGRTDAPLNWMHAETYVKTYYENIIPAIVEGNPENTRAVLRALQCDLGDPHSPCQIISAFEAALVTYFVPADSIQRVWNDNPAKPQAGHTALINEVPAATWPRFYEIPDDCKGLFEVGDRLVRFRGMMTVARKEALLSQLTSEPRQAIETLYERSRIVCREFTL